MTKFSINRRQMLVGAAAGLVAGPLLASRAFAITTDDIKKRGKIIIGIQGDNKPWGFINTSGQSDGIDDGMGKLFAKELGVQAQFVPLEVAKRIAALTSGRVEVLFATMAMLPERAKAVQFSEPYVANSIYLVAAKTTVVKTNADMGKLTIGVPRGSAQDTQVTNNAPPGTNILRFDGDAATIQALLSGQVNAVGGNSFYVQRLDASKPGVYENKIKFISIYNGACTRLGEKEINAAINSFIDKIKADGELAAIQKKWMGSSMMDFPKSIPEIPFVAS